MTLNLSDFVGRTLAEGWVRKDGYIHLHFETGEYITMKVDFEEETVEAWGAVMKTPPIMPLKFVRPFTIVGEK